MQGLAALVVLAAGALPGYVFVWHAERCRPRIERSGLLLSAELGLVGVFATLVASIAVAVASRAGGWFDVHALLATPGKYVAAHPERGITAILAVETCALALAYIAALVVDRFDSDSTSIEPASSAWKAGLDPAPGLAVFATVELRDGRRFAGAVSAFDFDAGLERRDLVLADPVFSVDEAGNQTLLEGVNCFLISSEQLGWIMASYVHDPSASPRRFRGLRRQKTIHAKAA